LEHEEVIAQEGDPRPVRGRVIAVRNMGICSAVLGDRDRPVEGEARADF
jgi:hypothetical protein